MSSTFDLNILVIMFLLKHQIQVRYKQMNTKYGLYLKYTQEYQSKLLLQILRFRGGADIISPCHEYIYIGEIFWVHLNSMER